MVNQNKQKEKMINDSNAYKGMIILMAIDSLFFTSYDETKQIVNGQVFSDRVLRFSHPQTDGKMLSIEVPLNENRIFTKEDSIVNELKIQKVLGIDEEDKESGINKENKALGINKVKYDPFEIRDRHAKFIGNIKEDSVRATALAIWKASVDTLRESQRGHDDKYLDVVLGILGQSNNQGMLNNMELENIR